MTNAFEEDLQKCAIILGSKSFSPELSQEAANNFHMLVQNNKNNTELIPLFINYLKENDGNSALKFCSASFLFYILSNNSNIPEKENVLNFLINQLFLYPPFFRIIINSLKYLSDKIQDINCILTPLFENILNPSHQYENLLIIEFLSNLVKFHAHSCLDLFYRLLKPFFSISLSNPMTHESFLIDLSVSPQEIELGFENIVEQMQLSIISFDCLELIFNTLKNLICQDKTQFMSTPWIFHFIFNLLKLISLNRPFLDDHLEPVSSFLYYLINLLQKWPDFFSYLSKIFNLDSIPETAFIFQSFPSIGCPIFSLIVKFFTFLYKPQIHQDLFRMAISYMNITINMDSIDAGSFQDTYIYIPYNQILESEFFARSQAYFLIVQLFEKNKEFTTQLYLDYAKSISVLNGKELVEKRDILYCLYPIFFPNFPIPPFDISDYPEQYQLSIQLSYLIMLCHLPKNSKEIFAKFAPLFHNQALELLHNFGNTFWYVNISGILLEKCVSVGYKSEEYEGIAVQFLRAILSKQIHFATKKIYRFISKTIYNSSEQCMIFILDQFLDQYVNQNLDFSPASLKYTFEREEIQEIDNSDSVFLISHILTPIFEINPKLIFTVNERLQKICSLIYNLCEFETDLLLSEENDKLLISIFSNRLPLWPILFHHILSTISDAEPSLNFTYFVYFTIILIGKDPSIVNTPEFQSDIIFQFLSLIIDNQFSEMDREYFDHIDIDDNLILICSLLQILILCGKLDAFTLSTKFLSHPPLPGIDEDILLRRYFSIQLKIAFLLVSSSNDENILQYIENPETYFFCQKDLIIATKFLMKCKGVAPLNPDKITEIPIDGDISYTFRKINDIVIKYSFIGNE